MFYGVILAGGGSTRMGADKRFMELNGQTLLKRTESLLESAGAEFVLISGSVPGVSCIPDTHENTGPPGAVLSVLEHVREHYGLDGATLLFVPVDMPLLSPATIRHLAESAVNATGCHYDNEVFPCAMKATPDLYTHLKDLFTQGTELGGKRSMRGIMTYLNGKSVPLSGVAKLEFTNVNTPEDWQHLHGTRQL